MEYKSIRELCHINERSIGTDFPYPDIKYLDTSSITQNVIIATQNFSIKGAPNRAKRLVKHNTIIYSSVRPNLQHFGILKKPEKQLVVSTGFITLDVINDKEIEADYLYYYITQHHVVEYLHCIAESSVSAYPSINPSDLGGIKIPILSLDEQHSISNILKSIEDKVRINRAINQNLPTLDRSSKVVEVHHAA